MDEEEFFEEEEIEEAIENEKEKAAKEKNNKNKDKKNKTKSKTITKNKTKVRKEKPKKNKDKKNKQREIIYRDKGHPFLTFLLVLIIMCLLGVVGYLVYENYYKEKEEIPTEKINDEIKEETPKKEMSKEDALLLGTNLYNGAYELYNGRANFSLNTEDSTDCDGEMCSLITNFDNVTNNIFTESAKKEFERNAKTIRKIDGKFYYLDNFELNPNSYIETNFEVSKITEDKVTFKAISDYCISDENTNCQNKESETKKFVIVKENNKWLVDEFINPVKE